MVRLTEIRLPVSLKSQYSHLNKIFRCLYRRCPPLPIPNREVKPARADGTAVKCGRVGRCQILKKPFIVVMRGFLVFSLQFMVHGRKFTLQSVHVLHTNTLQTACENTHFQLLNFSLCPKSRVFREFREHLQRSTDKTVSPQFNSWLQPRNNA